MSSSKHKKSFATKVHNVRSTNDDHSSHHLQLPHPFNKLFEINPQKILILITFIGLLLLSMISYSFIQPLQGADASRCKGVYMSPIYAKVEGFNESHTKFSSKYSLYLYRENGKDYLPSKENNFKLSGTPVLFIPGNAGSMKQVRSIASQSSIEYFETMNNYGNNLDFFSADFNEDFTAFHGRTILDQAEYLNEAIKFILTLYRKNNIPCKSVILLGHSMGGIVARVMLTLPNYLDDSINTIITLATPHAAAPVTFDGDLLNVFAETDEFWRLGFSKLPSTSNNEKIRSIAKKRLSNISLISITGGLSDTTLPSDYTTLIGLIPETNGFTVSTTGIPQVWTAMDHLAIVWCDQLRQILAKSLLSIVDNSSPYQTVNLDKRMKIFKKYLLTGFEETSAIKHKDEISSNKYQLKIDTKQLKETPREKTFQFPKTKLTKRVNDIKDAIEDYQIGSPDMHLFYIPKDGLNFKFNFISSFRPVNIEKLNNPASGASPSVLLCTSKPGEGKSQDDVELLKVFDYTTSETQHFVQLDCIDTFENSIEIPRSYFDTESTSESSISGQHNPFYFLEFNSNVLSNYEAVVIVESKNDVPEKNNKNKDFILADIQMEHETSLTLGEKSLWKLFTQGYDITLPAHRPLAINVNVPSAWSSLLAYSLDIRYQSSNNERFSPIIRQTSNDETKWHVNVNHDEELTSLLQGISPFCPFKNDLKSLKLQIFSDSLASDQIMDVYLSVDWFKSLQLLVLKYRLSIISFPVFITTFIMFIQFREYINSFQANPKNCHFPSFGEGLIIFCNLKILLPILFILSTLSYVTSQRFLQTVLELINPVDTLNMELMRQINSENHANMFFLGLGIEENALWFLGPVVLFISFALVCGFYSLINLLSNLITKLIQFFTSFNNNKLVQRVNSCRTKSVLKNKFKFVTNNNKRRILGTLVLLLMIPLYLPYQFAYTVCVCVQCTVVIKANLKLLQASLSSDEKKKSLIADRSFNNFKNFNMSILMIMLWILPVNIPILIVWVHNFSLRWSTPFSSHHNFFAVIPIVFLSQLNVNGVLIRPPRMKLTGFLTKFILIYFSLYSLVYGTRHLFWLHHLFNFFCAWLSLLYLQQFIGDKENEKGTEEVVNIQEKFH